MTSESEILGILGRIHVLLRRAANRITDIEYMRVNPEYAREVIRLSEQTGNAELLAQCAKLRAALGLEPEKTQKAGAADSAPADPVAARYLFSLR